MLQGLILSLHMVSGYAGGFQVAGRVSDSLHNSMDKMIPADTAAVATVILFLVAFKDEKK